MRPRKYYTVLEFAFLCFVLNYMRESPFTNYPIYKLSRCFYQCHGRDTFLCKANENVTLFAKKGPKRVYDSMSIPRNLELSKSLSSIGRTELSVFCLLGISLTCREVH